MKHAPSHSSSLTAQQLSRRLFGTTLLANAALLAGCGSGGGGTISSTTTSSSSSGGSSSGGSSSSPAYIVSTYAGAGATANTTLNQPQQATIVSSGISTFLYVVDAGNNQVKKIDIGSNAVSTLASPAGGYNNPTGVTSFNLFGATAILVADTGNHALHQIDSNGNVTTYGSSGNAGNSYGSGASQRFNAPSAMAADLSANGVNNSRNFFLDQGGTQIGQMTYSGFANFSVVTTSISLSNLAGIAADAAGNIYVSDIVNHVIYKIVFSTGATSVFAGTAGTAGSANGSGTAASFSSPAGLSYSTTSGLLYVADSGTGLIRTISSSGAVLTLAGAGTSGSANGAALSATFNSPKHVVPFAATLGSTTPTLYISDTGNNLIRKAQWQ